MSATVTVGQTSIIDATMSALEQLSEERQQKVLDYTVLLLAEADQGQFHQLSEEQMLADIQNSEQQIATGKTKPFDDMIKSLRIKYGF